MQQIFQMQQLLPIINKDLTIKLQKTGCSVLLNCAFCPMDMLYTPNFPTDFEKQQIWQKAYLDI